MRRDRLLTVPTDKVVEIVIAGEPVDSSQAAEIIRRTDSFFGGQSARRSPYSERVRALLGLPGTVDPGADPENFGQRRFEYWKTLEAYRARWGSLDLNWLQNAQVNSADGWCHPDGAIFIAERSGRYPLATDYFDDALSLASAFPFLALDIAVWAPRIFDDVAIHHAPDCPWPKELRERVGEPRFGLMVRHGDVEVVTGDFDPLFREFGLTCVSATEVALAEFRKRRRAGALDTVFGDRRGSRGVGDDLIWSWIETARQLRLIA